MEKLKKIKVIAQRKYKSRQYFRAQKKTVLLIEDDNALRENFAELMELSGYLALTAANGKSGIAKAKEHLPDIIICDIMMPEMDGYSVLDHLSKNEATPRIPFIFLSAKTDIKDIHEGIDLGADGYITKPYKEKDLLNTIEKYLSKYAK